MNRVAVNKATGSDAGRGNAAASDVSTTCNTVISKLHGFVNNSGAMSAVHTFSILFVDEFSCTIDDNCRYKLLRALLSPRMPRRVCMLQLGSRNSLSLRWKYHVEGSPL